MGVFLLTGEDALHLRQRGNIRESIDPEHDCLPRPGDPSLPDFFRLPTGSDDLCDVVDADRPLFDKALHVVSCDDALAGLDVDAEHTLGVLHAPDVFKGEIVVMHSGSHHIVIDGRDDIVPPCGVKVICNYIICMYCVYLYN